MKERTGVCGGGDGEWRLGRIVVGGKRRLRGRNGKKQTFSA